MPTRCNRGFYCIFYCLLNMFRAPLCPSSGADPQTKLYTTKNLPRTPTHSPPRHSTHLITNLDNTRHLRLRTQIPQKLTKLFFLHFYSTKYHGQQPLYNTLELLMMGILVPETCWASNKICNKNLCCI